MKDCQQDFPLICFCVQFFEAASKGTPGGADGLDYRFPFLDFDLSFEIDADGLFWPGQLQDVSLGRSACDELRWFICR